MTDEITWVTKILSLNGHELVGKTRLQKTAYFFESLGVGFGFDFEYYHYGPYSEELSIASDDAIALGFVSHDWKASKNLQSYAIFRTEHDFEEEEEDSKRKAILKVLERYDSVSIELAATADFLSKTGDYPDSWEETRRRKATKATPDRIEKARSLLHELSAL